MNNIEIIENKNLTELHEFKNVLLEIKYKEVVEFQIIYYQSLKLVAITSNNYFNIVKERYLTEGDFRRRPNFDSLLSIPYHYSIDPEVEAFLKEACGKINEFLLYLKENRKILFEDRYVKALLFEEIMSIVEKDFLSFNGILFNEDNQFRSIFPEGRVPSLMAFCKEYTPLKFKFKGDIYDMKISLSIPRNGNLTRKYLKIIKNDQMIVSVDLEELSNPHILMDRLHPYIVIISFMYFLQNNYRLIGGLYYLYEDVSTLLNTYNFDYYTIGNGFYIHDRDRNMYYIIYQYEYDKKLYYYMSIDTGNMDEYNNEDVVIYNDTMEKEDAILYLLEVIQNRTCNNSFVDKEILNAIFTHMADYLEKPSLIDEKGPVMGTAMIHLAKFTEDEKEGTYKYTKYNFFDPLTVVAEEFIFDKDNIYDLVLRNDINEYIGFKDDNREEINVKGGFKGILLDIHQEVHKRVNSMTPPKGIDLGDK